jgi:hypothetical protein
MFKDLGAGFRSRTVLASAVLALTLLGARQVPSAEKIVGEVVIESAGLQPPVLMTEPEHKVFFVNRSGQVVHIQFLMQDGGQHHIFQVPEQIWAIFHRPGRHSYVVHFRDPRISTLEGAVEVMGDSRGRPDPHVCSGITVQGACIER